MAVLSKEEINKAIRSKLDVDVLDSASHYTKSCLLDGDLIANVEVRGVESVVNYVYDSIKDREDKIEEMRSAMQEFCDRVDKGEIRSIKTYARFKAVLNR